ncbi:hypothetical protein CN693_00920 [Bacillus pseudomycoides]|nr:hypothetical protein CN693_00920 [Bacillus pseudomycoides]
MIQEANVNFYPLVYIRNIDFIDFITFLLFLNKTLTKVYIQNIDFKRIAKSPCILLTISIFIRYVRLFC